MDGSSISTCKYPAYTTAQLEEIREITTFQQLPVEAVFTFSDYPSVQHEKISDTQARQLFAPYRNGRRERIIITVNPASEVKRVQCIDVW